MNKKTPIIIVSPRQHHGGPIVLHLLCELLIKKGYNAKMFIIEGGMPVQNEKMSKFWLRWTKSMIRDTIKITIAKFFKNAKILKKPSFNGYSYMPVRKYKRKILPFIKKNTIVIYPELCYGNPLHAKNVVRWLLFHNRFPNDEKAYGKDDLFFCFRKYFNDEKLNPDVKELKLNNFDYDLYKQINYEERSGKCYMIRKGKERLDLPTEFDGPILDNLSEKQIVYNFNKYKYCYFYDTQTFYSSIAAICGCIPIRVCEENKSRSDYLGKDDCAYGVAYGDTEEEISYALKTRDKLIERIQGFKRNNDINVNNFIEECRSYFT